MDQWRRSCWKNGYFLMGFQSTKWPLIDWYSWESWVKLLIGITFIFIFVLCFKFSECSLPEYVSSYTIPRLCCSNGTLLANLFTSSLLNFEVQDIVVIEIDSYLKDKNGKSFWFHLVHFFIIFGVNSCFYNVDYLSMYPICTIAHISLKMSEMVEFLSNHRKMAFVYKVKPSC